jgi:hypothetical protein
VQRSLPFSIKLIDRNGIENEDRLHYSMTAVPDRPPVVAFINPEQGAHFAPVSKLRWKLHATDDFGMVAATLMYIVRSKEIIGAQGEIIQIAEESYRGELTLADLDGVREANLSGTISIKDMHSEPNHTVEMYISVTDRCTTRENDEQGKSQIKTINIVTKDELQRIITEELFGAHMLIKDINDDMRHQEKILEIKTNKGNK